EILRRLALLQLELRELALLLLLVGLLFLLGFDARVLDQLLFFGFDELLAVGLPRIALARPDVGQLDDAAWRVRRRGIDRDDEEIVFAREGHGRLTTRPARIRFGIRRARDLAARACHGIEEDDVGLVGEEPAAVRRVPHAVGRRRVAPLGVREFARRAAPARHDPRRRFVLARPPPLEIEPRRIAGPAQAARRITDELGTAHDAVDGQLESGLGRRRRSRKVHGGDRDGESGHAAGDFGRHGHEYTIWVSPNRTATPAVYCSEQRQVLFSWSSELCVSSSRFTAPERRSSRRRSSSSQCPLSVRPDSRGRPARRLRPCKAVTPSAASRWTMPSRSPWSRTWASRSSASSRRFRT